MLEFFRRHRGAFLTVLTVIIILSFSVWGGWKKGRGGFLDDPTQTAFTIYGKDYSRSELERLARHMRLAYMMGMYEFPQQLMMVARKYQSTRSDIPLDFVFNLIVLREELEKNDIAISDAEAKAELQKLPSLQNNGAFDAARASQLEENLGSMGFKGPDLLEMMKDKVGLDKLRELVAGNVSPSSQMVSKAYANQYQTVKASTITFSLEDFKKTAKVTDDEIKKYYDEKKDTFKTPEKRAISYVFFEEPKDLDKLDADKKAKAQKDFAKKVNDFNEASLNPKAKLEILAAGSKMKYELAGAFPQDAPPDAIKSENELVSAVFQHDLSRPISDPVKGTKGYYIFSVLKRDEPKQQDLKEVSDSIKTTLVAQKAQEAMLKAANDAREALQAGIKGGKKIGDLVKEKKLAMVDLPEYSPSAPSPDMMKAGREVTSAADKLPAGQLSTPVNTPTGAVLVYVNAKELRKRDDSTTLKQNVQESIVTREQFQVFQAWFEKRRDESKLKVHFNAA